MSSSEPCPAAAAPLVRLVSRHPESHSLFHKYDGRASGISHESALALAGLTRWGSEWVARQLSPRLNGSSFAELDLDQDGHLDSSELLAAEQQRCSILRGLGSEHRPGFFTAPRQAGPD